jgi:hypothetical protein
MTTLKDFEEVLREQGMHMALAILEKLRVRDRVSRSVAPARRVRGKKMTPELARRIVELHQTTEMTQQEIAFELGVNQGRVNEVIKHGKWLSGDPYAPEARARDKALKRVNKAAERLSTNGKRPSGTRRTKQRSGSGTQKSTSDAQFTFAEF